MMQMMNYLPKKQLRRWQLEKSSPKKRMIKKLQMIGPSTAVAENPEDFKQTSKSPGDENGEAHDQEKEDGDDDPIQN